MIRPYSQEDRDSVLDIFRQLIPEYFDPSEEEDLKEYLKNEASTCFVLQVDGQIVSLGGYKVVEEKVQLTWYFTHPDYKGKGYGSQLVEYCKAKALASSQSKKWLVRTSQLSEGFFARFGFETKIIEPNYWGKGLDLYIMTGNLQEDEKLESIS